MIDLDRTRREHTRWVLLLALHNARPYGTNEHVMLPILQALYVDATGHEVRLGLEYLEQRHLIELTKAPTGVWSAKLNRLGIDIVEYTADCQPGIARPVKYWG